MLAGYHPAEYLAISTISVALICMTPYAAVCITSALVLFAAKEAVVWNETGGWGTAEFWKSTAFNAATTGLTIAGGYGLSKVAVLRGPGAIASKWGGELFWGGIPSVLCGSWKWCASPRWEWPP